jgi:hypothetical protein
VKTARFYRRGRSAKKSARPYNHRLLLELLEDRVVLDNGQWLVNIGGLPGDTRQEQIQAAQELLAAAYSPDQIHVVDHMGADGILLVQTDPNLDQKTLTKDLRAVPGFHYVEAYNPDDDPDSRISYIPVGPAQEHDDGNGPTGAWGPQGPNGPNGPNEINGFPGITAGQGGNFRPPDSMGAVGPSSFIEEINSAVAIYNKTTGVPIGGGGITSLHNFFAPVALAGDFTGDPVVAYNDVTGNFGVGAEDFNHDYFYFAISKTSNPTLNTSDWNFFKYNLFDGTSGGGDYPKMGYNADGFVVSFNMFPSSFDHSSLLAIKNDGTSTGNHPVPGGFTHFTFGPASMHGSSAGDPMWLTETPGASGNAAGNTVRVVRMDNPYTATPTFTYTTLNVNAYFGTGNPHQPGGLIQGNANLGTRMYFSGFRKVGTVTHLVAAHTVADTSGGFSRIHWYDFDVSNPATPTLIQQGEINPGANVDALMPCLDINANGQIGLEYMQTSGTQFVSIYFTGRTSGDTLGTMQAPVLAKAGLANLNPSDRIGDYSFASVDPTDGTFWGINEYANNVGNPNWATWIEHWALGFSVSSSTPANGDLLVGTAPTTFVLHLSDPYDLASVHANALTVNGIAANSVALTNPTTLTFQYTTSPVTAEGVQSMDLAAGAILKQGTEEPLQAFHADFRYATVQLQVTATEPANNAVVLLPFTDLKVHFNRAYDPNTLTTSNLVLSQGTVTAATAVDATTADYTVAVTDEGPLTFTIAGGALTDVNGNPMLPYSGSFTLQIGTVPLPPTTASAPAGSLVYQTRYAGRTGIDFQGDTDNFTIAVNAGEQITVLVHPTGATLRSTVQLFDPGNTLLGNATAPAAGQDALLQTVAAATSGTYKVTVGGASGTLGAYTVQVYLNSALEAEKHGGPNDDTRATAQDLNGAFVSLGGSASRAAVLGRTDATAGAPVTVFAADFESGAQGFTVQNTGFGRQAAGLWHLSTGRGSQAGHSATHSFYYGQGEGANGGGNYQTDGLSNAGALVSPSITLPSGGLALNFNYVLQTERTTGYDLAQLQISTNGGASFTTLAGYNVVAESSTWRAAAPVNLSAYAGQTVQLRWFFDTVDGFANNFEGWYIDDVQIQQQFFTDYYSFAVNAGESVTLGLTGLSAGGLDVTVENAAGTTVAASRPLGTNMSRAINNLVFPTAGTFYARVDGTGTATDYSLVVTRNADFATEPNENFIASQAQYLVQTPSGTQTALGYLGGNDAQDVYEVSAAAGQTLTITTATPFPGPGQFVNTLDPMINLYAPNGSLVASDDNSAADGRNTQLSYVVPAGAGGLYFIQVQPSPLTPSPTSGEYMLTVTGGLTADAPFVVASTTVPDKAYLNANPTTLTVTFNHNVLLTSLTPAAVLVDGLAATGFTVVNGTTVIFKLPTLPTQLSHTVSIADGALVDVVDVSGIALTGYSGTFFVNTTPPNVIASSIQEGDAVASVAGGDLTYTVQFSEPLNQATVTAAAFQLHGQGQNRDYTPTSFTYIIDTSTLTLNFTGVRDDTYTLTLKSANLTDLFGLRLDGETTVAGHSVWPIPPGHSGDGVQGGDFLVHFSYDAGNPSPYPTSLTAVQPLGSLVYQGPAYFSTLQSSTDSDSFTLTVNPGQTITVLAHPLAAGLQPTIQLSNSGGPLGSVTAPGAGKEAVLQTIAAASADTYTITVGGAGGSVGAYTVQVFLNTALELKQHDGPPNTTLATAQNLDSAFVALPKNASRGAVLGGNGATFQTTTVFSTDLESGTAGFVVNNNTGLSGRGTGLWHLSTGRGSQSGHSATHSFYYGKGEGAGGGGNYDTGVANAGYLTSPSIALPANAQISAGFNYVLQTERFSGFDNADLLVSTNGGVSFSLLTRYSVTAESSVWRAATPVNLSAYAGQTVQLRWSFDTVDSLNNDFEGWYVDDIQVQAQVPVPWNDYYSFTLGAGDSVALSLKTLSGVTPDLKLLGPNGSLLATGSGGATNVDRAISSILVSTPGTYYALVTGSPAATFSVVVTRNAVFDTHPNDSFATAQDITGTAGALGYVGQPGASNDLTFDELPFQPVNGLHFKGVTFGFTIGGVPSTDAGYHGGGPGILKYVQDPSLEGNTAGVLTLTFDTPASAIDFGLALSTGGTVTDAAQIELFDSALNSLGSTSITTHDEGFFFTEAHFSYSGTSVKRAVLQFNSSAALRFAFDNLIFSAPPSVDYYSVRAAAGQVLDLPTSTPSDGSGVFSNTLSLHIELYDPSGALVASGVKQADGRNERIVYTVPVAGVYRIKVTADNGTQGEYFLDPIETFAAGPAAGPVAAFRGTPTGAEASAITPVLAGLLEARWTGPGSSAAWSGLLSGADGTGPSLRSATPLPGTLAALLGSDAAAPGEDVEAGSALLSDRLVAKAFELQLGSPASLDDGLVDLLAENIG